MKSEVGFYFLISFWMVSGAKPVCYDELGCFEIGNPWFTPLRPFPAPSSHQEINTVFYFIERSKTEKVAVQTWPKIEMGTSYNKNKETVIITHGFRSDTQNKWMKELTEAFLFRNDYNIYLVDWKKGASENYFQAASNTRIVAAEIIRLIRHLMENYSANPSTFYLMGHSLGAHVMSYVGKSISGIKRITALDPANPGFQGKNAEIRLHRTDAKFVDVIHTDATSSLPFMKFGMSESVGAVDFFVNGGGSQPGCTINKKKIFGSSFLEDVRVTEQMIKNYALCNHARAAFYMAVAIKGVCEMWGHPYNSTVARRNYKRYISNEPCDLIKCTLMGLETPDYPARGSFIVRTTANYPFCVPEKTID